jgi:hypothetical protein
VTVNLNASVAWRPDGGRIAFIGGVCCNYGVWAVDTNGQNLTELVPGGSIAANQVVWNAAGDSLIYTAGNDQTVYLVEDVVEPGFPVPVSRLPQQAFPALSSGGLALRSFLIHYDFFLLRASDGRPVRLIRSSSYSGDEWLTFRRGP